MARKGVWSYEAVADLKSLAEHIARDSPFYAASFVREIRDAGRSLARFSERGRVVILGLIHEKRDLAKLWKTRKETK